MKSLYTWIVIAMLATSSLALLAFTMITDRIQRAYVDPVLKAMDALELESARDSLRTNGAAAAARYLSRLDRLFGTSHYLLDGNGADVVSGDSRAGWLPHPPAVDSRGFLGERFVVTHRSQDGRYWLLSVGPRRRRRDELGTLGRSFDGMADRVERLLVAERRLLQDVSHELRSPLARLTMAVKLARVSPDPASALERVDRHLERLTSLTAEVVEMIRIEGDPQAQRWEPVDLDGLVAEIVADCGAEAEPRACELRVDGHITGRESGLDDCHRASALRRTTPVLQA